MAEKFITWSNVAIGAMLALIIGVYGRVLNQLSSIYRVLQELYDFEVRYQIMRLDELEDSLDIYPVHPEFIENLIINRRL